MKFVNRAAVPVACESSATRSRRRRGSSLPLAILVGSASFARAQSFQETVELTASETSHYDTTGCSVALANDVMVAGACQASIRAPSRSSGHPGSGKMLEYSVGAAYVFRRTSGVWNEEQRLLASDPVEYARFGWSIATTGNVVVVGATAATGRYGVQSGAAYVFRWNGSTWKQEHKLLPSDSGARPDEFGYSVAISGNVIVVGAPGIITGGGVGAAYIFRWSAGQWTEEAKITDPNSNRGDVGTSVSIDKDLVAVGEPGASEAQVVRYSNGQWNLEQTLKDGSSVYLGSSLSVFGDAIAVGDPGDHTDTGAVAIFRFNGTSWNEEQKVYPSDGNHNDLYGIAVSLGQDLLIVGASLHSPTGKYSVGQAYAVSYSGTNWNEIQKLDASDGESGDEFSQCVALYGNDLAIGAPYDGQVATGGGSIYMFQK